MKGTFIVIEGNDGSGKGTQFELLAQYLRDQGKEVVTMDFPQYGAKSAGPVEEYLNGKYGSLNDVSPKTASLFYAVDRFDASFKIRTALEQGKIVLSNRYVLANSAYQGAKIKNIQERQEFFNWINELEYDTLKLPQPDLIIFLYVPAEIAYELVLKKKARAYLNGKKQDIHETDKEYLKTVEQTYLELARQNPKIITLECAPHGQLLNIEEIKKQIIKLINT